MTISFSYWDLVLVAVVSLQATLLAYLHHPKWKAFLLTLPLPFTFATLSVGQRVDATNVTGLILLLLFTHGVRLLHYHARLPILPSIVLPALGYCAAGTGLAAVMPRTEASFWMACVATLALAGALYAWLPHRVEPGHRSPLPVWIKFPIICGVILFLVGMKQVLQGFMTIFPMVGVVAAYEARHCLWTICRQIPVVMLTMLPMMILLHVLQPRLGLAWALPLGWLVFLLVLIPFTRRQWAEHAEG